MGCVTSKKMSMDVTQPSDAYSIPRPKSQVQVSDSVSGLPPLDLRLSQKASDTPAPPTTKVIAEEPPHSSPPPVPSARTRALSSSSSSDQDIGERSVQRFALDLLDKGKLNDAHMVISTGIESMGASDPAAGLNEVVLAIVKIQQGRLREGKNTLERIVTDGHVNIPAVLKDQVEHTLELLSDGKLSEAKNFLRNTVEKHLQD